MKKNPLSNSEAVAVSTAMEGPYRPKSDEGTYWLVFVGSLFLGFILGMLCSVYLI